MSTGLVRDLALTDLSALVRLYRDLHPGEPDAPTEDQARLFESILESPAHVYLGAFTLAGLVATGNAVIVPNLTRGGRPYGVLENIVSDARFRRQGFGAAVVRALLERCWTAGCYKVMLQSAMHRADAHAFYTRLGFDPDAKRAFVARPP